MPGAKTHDAINLYAAPLVGMAAYAVTHRLDLAALVGAGHVLGTIYLSPDLDLVVGSIDDRWGVLRFIWRPYGLIVRHRSVLSHSGVSAVLRLLYLVAVAELAGAVLGLVGLLDFVGVNLAAAAWLAENADRVAAFVAGGVVSDTLHTAADLSSTWLKTRALVRQWRSYRQGSRTR